MKNRDLLERSLEGLSVGDAFGERFFQPPGVLAAALQDRRVPSRALKHREVFREAMWATVSGLGDRDTTCAIVGGLVALSDPPPAEWISSREPLPSD